MIHLVVVDDFGKYRKGDIIKDSDEVSRIRKERPTFVVAVSAKKTTNLVEKPATAAKVETTEAKAAPQNTIESKEI